MGVVYAARDDARAHNRPEDASVARHGTDARSGCGARPGPRRASNTERLPDLRSRRGWRPTVLAMEALEGEGLPSVARDPLSTS